MSATPQSVEVKEHIDDLLTSEDTAGARAALEITPSDIGAEPELTPATTVEMEAGTETEIRSMSPLRVAEAIAVLAVAEIPTANVLWVSKSGNDSTGTRERFDLPYLTLAAANADAVAGDTIRPIQGDYSAETITAIDGVYYDFVDSIGPTLTLPVLDDSVEQVSGTFAGRGTIKGLTLNKTTVDFGAIYNINMADMTVIERVSLSAVGTGGNNIIADIGNPQKGVACAAGASFDLTLGGDMSHTSETIVVAADVSETGVLRIKDGTRVVTTSGNAIYVADTNASSPDVAVRIGVGCKIKGTTNGIYYFWLNSPPPPQIGSGTIIQTNTGGKSINGEDFLDDPLDIDVILAGTMCQTHAPDANVTFIGGTPITNTNFTTL